MLKEGWGGVRRGKECEVGRNNFLINKELQSSEATWYGMLERALEQEAEDLGLNPGSAIFQ